ncbi:hypothetical protein Har1130_03695 [Haloarcula sp. CBA1130]|uniref:hypothetical protein n=1 Tax=unclassified Haloarcula TaxID=2624677 RepID=UPI001247237C|nr:MULTISPECIES: hypothetical protein [unclassified Haloarcula]KAA9398518.1 hypothetical protein Har1129_09960 [Haloarcula sp. CBA1129]KAA9401890.1 hypothetical protein Har1130_03695 [Haloarcula sp. CBA1130]
MSAALDTLRDLFPDFGKARRERNRIRKRYRDNLNALDRDDAVFTISSRDYSPEYLGNRTEKKLSDADHLIQKHGSQSDPHSYQVTSNEDEVEEAMADVVTSITRRNYLNIFAEIVFIVFTVVCISLAILLAIAGIGTVVSQITGLEQTSNASATVISSTGSILGVE